MTVVYQAELDKLLTSIKKLCESGFVDRADDTDLLQQVHLAREDLIDVYTRSFRCLLRIAPYYLKERLDLVVDVGNIYEWGSVYVFVLQRYDNEEPICPFGNDIMIPAKLVW